MGEMGLAGVIRGKPVRTTISDKTAPCPLDHVNRLFHAPAPNQLWQSNFTYVATWAGFIYVAFVIDAYARRIVGRSIAAAWSATGDRGSQYVSIKYTVRLTEAGVEPSVGSVGDSYTQKAASAQ